MLRINWKHLRPGRYEMAALALIIFALVLRIVLIALHWPETTSEEGTFGLEAMHIAYRGEWPIFMYGQNYMGVLESYIGAVYYHIFGPTLFSLRLGMLTIFAAFLICIYYLTKLLYTQKMALVTLALLAVGSRGILVPEMMALGGAVETLFFGALLMLLATWLALTAQEEIPRRKKWGRVAVFAAWGCAVGLGLWSHMLVAPFVLFSGLILLVFCWRDLLRGLALLSSLVGMIIGFIPLIVYNINAAPGQDSVSTLIQLYTFGNAHVPLLFQKEMSGTFLFSLPIATGMNTICDSKDLPFLDAAGQPYHWHCILLQGGWSPGYLLLLTVAIGMAVWGLWKLWNMRRSKTSSWSAEDRHNAVIYFAQLMLLLTAVVTIVLFAHSQNSALRPWSTRYMIGLLVATPAVIWPLWNGISTRITSLSTLTKRSDILKTLLRRGIIGVIGFIFVVEMIFSVSIQAPANIASVEQDNALVHDLLRIHATHIYSGYWTCDRIVFFTQEKIICSDISEDLSPGLQRYMPYRTIIDADPNSTYVLIAGSAYADSFAQRYAENPARWRKYTFDGYVVYQPVTAG